MANEFDLIAQYFSRPVPARFLGVGDDCALLPIAPGCQLAVSTDLLIEGRHFLSDIDPFALGHKALAVNISDLGAMGAEPLACLLSLSMPAIDPAWLRGFSDGFYALAELSGCHLVGGDTTCSPIGIVINVTVMGQVDPAKALRRSAAKADDDIWITGTLGAPDIALQLLQGKLPDNPEMLAAVRPALERPMPPWALGQKLAGIAHAAIDISDGLAQDLGHILDASQCGADVDYAALPVDEALRELPQAVSQAAVLGGGDVYQLCFTAPASRRREIAATARELEVRATRVGCITARRGLRIHAIDGVSLIPAPRGFDHFA